MAIMRKEIFGDQPNQAHVFEYLITKFRDIYQRNPKAAGFIIQVTKAGQWESFIMTIRDVLGLQSKKYMLARTFGAIFNGESKIQVNLSFMHSE